MPLQYLRDDRNRLYRVTLTGDVTVDDLASFVADQITDGSWRLPVLYDATSPDVTLTPLQTVSMDLWHELTAEHGPRGPVAFAVADERQRAIAAGYTAAARAENAFTGAVFSDVDAAERWLDAHRSGARPPTIRPAGAGDLDAIVRIWHSGWIDGHIGNVPTELVAHRSREQFVERAEQRLENMWVAEARGEVLGFVVVVADEVEQIYVDAPARGTGVAMLLLRKAEAEIRRAGHGRAWLAVVAGNRRARAFYARHGWRDAGPMSYLAETDAGPLAVPAQRYEIDLAAVRPEEPTAR